MNQRVAQEATFKKEAQLSPELADISSMFDEYSDALEDMVKGSLEVLDAIGEYRERRYISSYPIPEELEGHEIVGMLPAIGKAVTELDTGKFASNFDGAGVQMGPHAKLGVSRLGKTHEIEIGQSRLTMMSILNFGKKTDSAPNRKMLDTIRESVQNPGKLETWVDYSKASDLIDTFAAEGSSTFRLEAYDLNDPESPERWIRKLSKALRTIPSEATLDTIAGLAYLDTLRGVIDNSITYSAEMNAAMEDRGATKDEIATYTAARTLDMARLAIDESSDHVRMTALARIVGISKFRASLTAASKLASGTRAYKGSEKLIAYGHDAMVDIHRIGDDRIRLQALLDNDQYSTSDLMKDFLRNSFDFYKEGNDRFYEAMSELNVSPDDEDTLGQMLALERYKNSKITSIVETYEETGLFRKDEITTMHELAAPHLANWLEVVSKEEELGLLREFEEHTIEEIDNLELPYKYTSSRIRSFEGGLDLARELNDLDKDNVPLSPSAIQSLSMLILQSEQAEDKENYFNDLVKCRRAIEENLRKLEFLSLGKGYRSNLIDVLKWVDELVDSGRESAIRNKRIQNFIDTYYLGYDSEEAEDDNILEEVTDESIEDIIEKSDEDTSEEQDIEEPPTSKDIPSPVEAYMKTLVDVLGEVDISWVDIDVFPPSKGDRIARGAISHRNESLIDIDPARLKNIVELKKSLEHKGKIADLMVTNPTSWSPLPHFVLYVKDDSEKETGICLMESPVNGNASYIFHVDGQLIQDWRELAQMSKSKARYWGADTFIHPTKNSQTFEQHYNLKLMNYILLGLTAQKVS